MTRWEDKRKGSRQEGEGTDHPVRGIDRGLHSAKSAIRSMQETKISTAD